MGGDVAGKLDDYGMKLERMIELLRIEQQRALRNYNEKCESNDSAQDESELCEMYVDVIANMESLNRIQKPVKPEWRRGRPYCGKCGLPVDGRVYCEKCGKKVDWDAEVCRQKSPD